MAANTNQSVSFSMSTSPSGSAIACRWRDFAVAPNTVHRPQSGHNKSYAIVKCGAIEGVDGLTLLWDRVRLATKDGLLGYYSARSDDQQVVAIHYTNKCDETVIESMLTYWGAGRVEHKHDTAFNRDQYHPDAIALLFGQMTIKNE